MPSFTRVARAVRLVTLPETRAAIVGAAGSATMHDIARRARADPAGLLRDLRNRDNARDIVRSAARHPATRELTTAGLMFLPMRYVPIGWVATWAARRLFRRDADPAAGVVAPRVAVADVSRT